MKKIAFRQAQFITSTLSKSTYPHVLNSKGKPMPEIALVGRSNVGKSSLINHLLNHSKLAKTSSTPGKTRSINFFAVDQEIMLVDLPGYGYAKVSQVIKEHWSKSIDDYLQQRSNLKLILLLLDLRRQPTEEDCALIQWANFYQKPVLILFTKKDKVKETEIQQKTSTALHHLKKYAPMAPIHFLHYSIKDPRARIELIKKINQDLE